jgi:hypothetical protein
MDVIDRIHIDTVRADDATRDANSKHQTDKHVNECFLCERGLTESGEARAWWVRMAIDGTLVPFDAELPEDEDQGEFPVGPECAKGIPLTHRAKLDDVSHLAR